MEQKPKRNRRGVIHAAVFSAIVLMGMSFSEAKAGGSAVIFRGDGISIRLALPPILDHGAYDHGRGHVRHRHGPPRHARAHHHRRHKHWKGHYRQARWHGDRARHHDRYGYRDDYRDGRRYERYDERRRDGRR